LARIETAIAEILVKHNPPEDGYHEKNTLQINELGCKWAGGQAGRRISLMLCFHNALLNAGVFATLTPWR